MLKSPENKFMIKRNLYKKQEQKKMHMHCVKSPCVKKKKKE